jgi:chromosome segregation ATPase
LYKSLNLTLYAASQQLKDAQAQAAAVQAANASLREETSSGQSRLDRTIEALRIASSNATKARADADAAEATAATLAQTLQNLKTVLTETKRASQILHQEQQELNATVAVAESKFIQKEAELLQAKKEIAMLRDSNATLETTQIQFSKERENFAHQVKQLEDDLEVLKREKQELNTMEKARKDRFDKVEQEWRKTQTLLVEATSGQAAALQSQSALEETIVALQKANEEIHASLKEQQRIARDDKHRLTESLGKVEKEAQRLRIAAEEKEEEIARLKASKEVTEKQVQQLKSRLSSTERSLKEATIVATTTTPMSSNASPDAVTTPMIPNQLSFQLPPLSTTSSVGKKAATSLLSNSTTSVPTITEKENIGVQNGELCCVCYKPSIGIMKVCQCGTKQCHKKAHANCIKFMNTPAGPSVSHPGTPAPKLPIVLCDHNNHHNNHPPPTTTTKLRSIQ